MGSFYAREINEIQARLNVIGEEIGLNRVLILHQFSPTMLPDKALIEDYPYVEILIDGDGRWLARSKDTQLHHLRRRTRL